MTDKDQIVEAHWTVTNLGAMILDALQRMGKNIDALTPADLAPIDEFHVRGRKATEELASLAEVGSDWEVLDVGSGLGGSARYLAIEHGCEVTGIDLTQAYCDVATMLSRRLALDGRTVFRQGSALAMPFTDARFDLVWTEHVQMNIADKKGLYTEITRVLKPGGRLAFHDIFQGPGGEAHFPSPWAGDRTISHLVPTDTLGALLAALGFRVLHWQDVSEKALVFFRQRVDHLKAHGFPPLGTHLLTGADAAIKLENQVRNLEEDRTVFIQAVLEKTP